MVIVLGMFSFPVVHAPAISRTPNTLTQYTSTGFVAHTYLGGSKFSLMYPGQTVTLIFADGHVERFKVTNVYQYQALTIKDFRDLETGEFLDQYALFQKVYKPNQVTFQTCISKDGQLDFGRLFVVAERRLDDLNVRADPSR